jgi:hypothetical protein
MPWWRNARDGNTGMATRSGSGCVATCVTYEPSDISDASNSRCRSIRKNVSSTGRFR